MSFQPLYQWRESSKHDRHTDHLLTLQPNHQCLCYSTSSSKGFANQKLTRLRGFLLLLLGFIFSFTLLLLWDKYEKESKIVEHKIMAKAAGRGSVLKKTPCKCKHILAIGDGWPVFQVTEGLLSCPHRFGVFNLPEGSEGAFCALELVGLSGQHKCIQFSSFLSSIYCGTRFYICVIVFSRLFFYFFHSPHFILFSYFRKQMRIH